MKLSYYISNKLAEAIAVFLVNIVVYLISMLFLKVSLWECCIFSIINAVWMPFILLPIIERMPSLFKQYMDKLKVKSRTNDD